MNKDQPIVSLKSPLNDLLEKYSQEFSLSVEKELINIQRDMENLVNVISKSKHMDKPS